MKKLLLTIVSLFICIGIVQAKNCEIISGDGKHIGDEIKCGTESFYVIDYNETQTSLLSKYNLFVGDKIDYIEAEQHQIDPETADYNTLFEWAKGYCDTFVASKGYNAYYTYPMLTTEAPLKLNGCRIYEKIDYEHVVQDERAVGTKLVNGKSQLPLYGITYMVPEWGYEAIHDHVIKENVYDANGNLVLDNSPLKKYIDGYKQELERQGIHVDSVNFNNLDGIKSVMKKISGREVELEFVYTGTHQGNSTDPNEFTVKMDIKDYVSDNYKWLYSTTYWIGSGFNGEGGNYVNNSMSEYNDYYISNEGFLCALGRGMCGYFAYPIGNGIRPTVVVANEYILPGALDGDNNDPGENPNTGAFVSYIVVVIVAMISMTVFIVSERKKQLNKVV
jgi:hypothetical protein